VSTAAVDVETPDANGGYPRLSEAQIEALVQRGEHRPTDAGDVLYRVGDVDYPFVVVVDGLVALVDDATGEGPIVRAHTRGRFLGEIGLLTGEPAFLTAVARAPGSVVVVPAAQIRALAADDTAIGDLILRAYLIRRAELIELGAGFRILGSRYSNETRRLREFAARNRLPHRFIDLEEDAMADALVRQLGVRPDETPIVIWGGDVVLRNPSTADLARAIGLVRPPATYSDYDLVIVGAGPAGLAAAVYGASEGLFTSCLDAVATGGQAGTSSRIENYLGFPAGLSGGELAERAVIQASKFGAEINVGAEVKGLEDAGDLWLLHLDDGTTLSTHTVVVASGARYRTLDVPDMDRFESVCVFHAATLSEVLLCARAPVAVVGGGNSAGQAAIFLTEYTDHVHLLVRDGELGKSMSRYLVDRIEHHPGIEVCLNTEVRELRGDRVLEAVIVENNQTHVRKPLAVNHLFVFIGAAPRTQWLADRLAVDDHGFILTGGDVPASAAGAWSWVNRVPSLLETSSPGVLAAGDVRSGSVKRVATAVGEGAMTVALVHRYLAERGVRAGQTSSPR
jgi:thioredoxin reductase (NADPH)